MYRKVCTGYDSLMLQSVTQGVELYSVGVGRELAQRTQIPFEIEGAPACEPVDGAWTCLTAKHERALACICALG